MFIFLLQAIFSRWIADIKVRDKYSKWRYLERAKKILLSRLSVSIYSPLNRLIQQFLAIAITAIIVLLLLFVSPLQNALTQEFVERDIPVLTSQFEDAKKKLISIDDKIASLERQVRNVSVQIALVKEKKAKPKGIWGRITGIFSSPEKELGKLYANSMELDREIRDTKMERKLLVNEFIILANELIEKSSIRIEVLMETLRIAASHNDAPTWEAATKQWSGLLDLAERTRESRDKYVPNRVEQSVEPPTLVSEDPRDFQLWIAALKDAAELEQAEIARLDDRIRDSERRERQLRKRLEVSRERRRRTAEREATGIGLSLPPWGGDAATEREIEDVVKEINELKLSKQEHEEQAERYRQQAQEIEAQLKEKSQND